MKKNVAGQVIGAQMNSATDGSAFTGAVTVSVTGDGGTQATGSVGAGACTHEGNGYHTYAPAQAETNYELIAFTFTGSGAIPSTVQVFTAFPQSGDSFARLGAPAGASVSADLSTIAGYIDTEVGSILASVDTEVAAIKAKTDNLPALPAAVGDIPTAIENADALLDRNLATGADTNTRSLRNAIRFLRNKWSISGSTLTVTKEDDSTSAWTAVLTTNAAADPVTGSDPV